MIKLYDNPFSPFARKVRIALDHKALPYESIDALAVHEHAALARVHPRAEVPVLVDGEVVVANSSEILAYLEDAHPDPRLMPDGAAARAKARAWQRLADVTLDAIIHDISIWTWPTHRRQDAPPEGLVAAGMADLSRLLGSLDAALVPGAYLCETLSVADLALFPHVSSLRVLGVGTSAYPKLEAWIVRMRGIAAVRKDLDYVKSAARAKFADGPSPYESEKIVWRGDRIEWLFHHGFVDWWVEEWRAGRAVVPSSL